MYMQIIILALRVTLRYVILPYKLQNYIMLFWECHIIVQEIKETVPGTRSLDTGGIHQNTNSHTGTRKRNSF